MIILYIDDDEDDLVLFQAAMVEVDPSCQYFQASDGKKGLSMLQSITPDYIFLDVNMPCMSGLTVLETIRADKQLRDIPTIMFSTTIRAEDELVYRNKGANGCIEKPNTFHELCNILRSVFSHEEIF
ncbi:MAG TPA: response regulator [Chryseolinea sp.]|nr:response regulator [Chryseolinea sp.]